MNHPFSSAPGPRPPRLEAMIRAAREQSAPAVTVTLEDIRAAASARRTVRWWGGLAAAAVVSISLWAIREGDAEPTAPAPRMAAVDEPMSRPAVERIPAVASPQPNRTQQLASGSIEPLEGAADPTAPGEDEHGLIALTEGRYRVQTTDAAMVVSVAGRVLEISAASDLVVDARIEHSSFRVVKGKANWLEPGDSPPPLGPDAKQLATQAEAALLSGRLEEAVRLLRKLVSAHPRGPATKAGLIDLARLEQRLGRPGRAHCAYALFSKRFPTDARTPTVRSADDALGLTSRCRGLRPISK